MRENRSEKGMIPVAMAFVVTLSIILATCAGLFWNKVTLSVSRLKRYQAINYTKTALREAARRFWGDYVDGGVTWDAKDWADGTAVPPTPTVVINGVTVDIDVGYEGASPVSGAVPRWTRKIDSTGNYIIRVSATVSYGNINL